MVGYKSAMGTPEATLAPEDDALSRRRAAECERLGVQHYEGSYNWPRADFVTNPYPVGSQWFQKRGFSSPAPRFRRS